jgi:hypothetical protein
MLTWVFDRPCLARGRHCIAPGFGLDIKRTRISQRWVDCYVDSQDMLEVRQGVITCASVRVCWRQIVRAQPEQYERTSLRALIRTGIAFEYAIERLNY